MAPSTGVTAEAGADPRAGGDTAGLPAATAGAGPFRACSVDGGKAQRTVRTNPEVFGGLLVGEAIEKIRIAFDDRGDPLSIFFEKMGECVRIVRFGHQG